MRTGRVLVLLAVVAGACGDGDGAPSTAITGAMGAASTAPPPTTAAVEEPPSSPPNSVPAGGTDLELPEPGREITFDGVGPTVIGQLLDPAMVTQYEVPGSCGYWGPVEPSHDGNESLGGLVTGADSATPKVLTIMVRSNSAYRTASGVGIGTALATLERVYGEDLVVDRADGWEDPTQGLLASYQDVAAVKQGERALTFYLMSDAVAAVKVSDADLWGDDEGCA